MEQKRRPKGYLLMLAPLLRLPVSSCVTTPLLMGLTISLRSFPNSPQGRRIASLSSQSLGQLIISW